MAGIKYAVELAFDDVDGLIGGAAIIGLGVETADVCRRHGISSATFYSWRRNYGGLEATEARRLRELGSENAKLKRIVASQRMQAFARRLMVDQMPDMSAMKELLEKRW